MTSAPGVGPFSADQSACLRRSLEKKPGSDLSPGERYSAEVAGDSVVLTEIGTGKKRTVPVKGAHPVDVSVSDRGDLAIVAEDVLGQGNLVGRLQRDGDFQQADQSYGASSPELSADGSRLTWLALCDVKEAGPDGPRTLGTVPYVADRSTFLDDGRLLVRVDRDPWNTGNPVPHYWLLDPTGAKVALDDVALAETLGAPVRERLEGVHASLFKGATPRQCQELVDLFGYRTPTFRFQSPTRERAVFWTDPGAPGQPFGLYRIEPGKGSPVPALSPADAATIGDGRSGDVVWQPGERLVAIAFEGPGRRAGVVDFEGTSRLLPGELAKTKDYTPLWWSPDGRWLAVEMKEGERTAVHVYDVEKDALTPVVADGRVQGWRDGNLQVKVDGVLRSMPPGPLDRELGREYVLGPKAEEAGSIQEAEGEVRVGDIRLPVRPASP